MKIFILILFFTINLHSQNTDTLFSNSDSVLVNQNDTLSTDTTGLLSATKNIIKADTLEPLNISPLFDESYFISRNTILNHDYRYAADILRRFPFTFIQDKGVGQQSNFFLYGMNSEGISVLRDGIPFNNYISSLDLNKFQTEFIDSIEIVPSVRGFLYGLSNNPVSLNFITKDYLSVVPYSRIKYYQGPSGEAFVDGFFSALLFKDLNISFDISNRSIDSTFTNSEFSIWQAKVRLKYFFSNSFNVIGTYGYVKTNRGLNGGIDIDSIAKTTSAINDVLYDPNTAPVIYSNREEEYVQHFTNLKFLIKPLESLKGSIDLYYKFYQDKIFGIDTNRRETKDKSKVFGLSFNQKYRSEYLNISLLGNYQNINYNLLNLSNPGYNEFERSINHFSVASIFSLNLFNNKLIPSVFVKQYNGENSEDENLSINGIGSDISYSLNNSFKFYFGYSNYKINQYSDRIDNYELGANYLSGYMFLDLRYFVRDAKANNNLNPFYADMSGISIKADFNLWKILIETETSFYSSIESQDNLNIPETNLRGGIYYRDILFQSNLNLKAGFLFDYTGEQNLTQNYSHEVLNFFNNKIESSLRIDFTVVGRIQKVAIIYFTWENLSDKQYFITPAYPMPSRNIRFGLAWELFN